MVAIMTTLAPFVGASAHPRNAAGVFDRNTAYFKLPQSQRGLLEWEYVYLFNSLGFRAAEYDPSAALRVFVCGCSYAFGMGIPLDHKWPAVFTRLVASGLGISLEQSNVQNFSQIGASNNYVARTLIKQCNLVAPTLAIAAFTHISRVEYLNGPEIKNLGYWNIHPDNRYPEPYDSPGQRFFRQYSERAGLQNLLTNMVLFQSAMINRKVPYIMVWIDVDQLHTETVVSDPILSDYYKVLDQSRISRLSLKQNKIHVDTVEGHPGPCSHERFAAALTREFSGCLLECKSSVRRSYAADTIALRHHKRSSATRLTRQVIRAVSFRRPRVVSLVFSDTLAVEHFVGDRAVKLDLERHAWTTSTARLRAAFADYITPDILRLIFLLNMLTVQEFLRAEGIELHGLAPAHWFLKRGEGSPVLSDMSDLLDRRVISPLPTRAPTSKCHDLSMRLEDAKRWLHSSRFEALLRRLASPPEVLRRDDQNIYPLW